MTAKYLYAAALAIALTATSALAESVWVKAETAELRAGKAAVFPAVAPVKKGQELSVLSRDGKWIQVQTGSTQGWIHESSISPQKVDAGMNLIAAGSATAEMGTGIAARGLQPDAENYVQSRRLSKQPLESLIALRKSIPPAEYVAFTTQGNVGAK